MTRTRWFALLLLLAGCSQEPITNPGSPDAPGELITSNIRRTSTPGATAGELAAATAGNSDFGAALYQELARTEQNLIFSPLSISQAFAMVHVGARGNTEAQIQQALRFTLPQERLHPAMNALDLALHSRAVDPRQDQVVPPELHAVNATWGQQGYSFEPSFLDVLARQYGAGLHAVDFARGPEALRSQINAWVAGQTNERIQDLLPEGSVTSDTRLVLTNTLYFKGAWATPFQPNATQSAPFHLLEGGTLQVQMMRHDGMVPYMQGADFEALALPYKGQAFRMLIIVPASGRLPEVESRLSAEFLDGIRAELWSRHLILGLPKFQTETAISLAEPLGKFGMVDAFSNAADFSGITQQERLLLSSAWHKAFVAVDEHGTEAAAATGLIGVPISVPVPFTVDRPFIFLIEHEETKTVLFLGRIVKP